MASPAVGSHSPRPPVKNNASIGHYQVLQTLGSGSFGKVKLAVHDITGLKVALKFISRKKITSLDMTARVKREIQYLRYLRHPHIIKLYEVIPTATDIVMVIEYAGGELFNYIVEKGKMPEAEARRFFQQIICAIEYCHRHSIVHRDLKPENLLLDASLNIKIGDFGLSNIMTDGDFLKTSCGSPNYAAPEVISGKRYAGAEIDVWSSGVILYVMLCGRLPFDDDFIPTLFKKINGGIYHLPAHLSPETKYLLSQMLVVDPLKRITVEGIRNLPWFQQDLPKYLQRLPPTPSSVSASQLNNLTSLISATPTTPQEEARARGWDYSTDLGVIDPKVVHALSEKLDGWTVEDLMDALKKEGDNQIKVWFQLERDHRRMLQDATNNVNEEERAIEIAVSSPAWDISLEDEPLREEHHHLSSGEAYEGEYEDEYMEEPDLATSNFAVLDSSLPGAELPADPNSIHLNSLDASIEAATQILAAGPPKKKSDAKQRWHFGIRSRSPPMEVMLEIYKTLKTLGMEWRKKEPLESTEGGKKDENGAKNGKGGKKDHAAEEKHAQGLYFVETRCRVRDIVIRMDLQLYRVDEKNYLVDFRNVGYYRTAPDQEGFKRLPAKPMSLEEELLGSSNMPNGGIPGGEVGSPFLFLDCATRLIVELAG